MSRRLLQYFTILCCIFATPVFSGCAFDSIGLFQGVERSLETLDDSLNAVVDLADLKSISRGTQHFLQKDMANNTNIIDEIDINLAEEAITSPEATSASCVLDLKKALPQGRYCLYTTDRLLLGLFFPATTTVPADARLTDYRQTKTSNTEKTVAIELHTTLPEQPAMERNLWSENLRIERTVTQGSDFSSVTTTYVFVNFGGCPDPARNSSLCRPDSDAPDRYFGVGRTVSSDTGTRKTEVLTLARPITGEIAGQPIAATFQSEVVLSPESALEIITVFAEFDQSTSSGTASEIQVARNGITTVISTEITQETISVYRETSTGRRTSTSIDTQTEVFSRTTHYEPAHGTETLIENGTLLENGLAVTRTVIRRNGKEKQIRVSATQETEDITKGTFWHSSRETTGVVQARKTEFANVVQATLYTETGRLTEVDAVAYPGDEFEANFWITRPGTDCDVDLARPGLQDAEGYVYRNPEGRIDGRLKYCAGDTDIRFATIEVSPGRLPRISGSSGGSSVSATRQLDIQ